MYHGVNPEAIGVFGLIVTVLVFGLEQLGVGMKDANHEQVRKTLALVAFFFGGLAQLFTALVIYLGNPSSNSGLSIYLGTIFADFGLFWLLVAAFFTRGGDQKVMAHFFIVQCVLNVIFTYIAFSLQLFWPLGTVLALIVLLFIALPIAYYGKAPIMGKVAGVLNIAIGVCAIPILLKALTEILIAK